MKWWKIFENIVTGVISLIVYLVYLCFKLIKIGTFRRPGYENIPDAHANLKFYQDEIPSKPDGDTIENILRYWYGDYNKLERHHGYIQWLFPNRASGLNKSASVLTDYEASEIKNNQVLRERVRRCFEMMLDFYGMELTLDRKFQLAENQKERLQNLNNSPHNYLRITRILFSLDALGHKDLQLAWLEFLGDLIYKKELLNAKENFEKFWLETVDQSEREKLRHIYGIRANGLKKQND